MPILNYTTTVEAEKSAAEIITILARKGARRVTQEFNKDGLVIGVSFTYEVAGVPVFFVLPANEDGVDKHMTASRKSKAYRNNEQQRRDLAQARRVAWRILKDWIEAQIALVETQQAEMAQVFLPYAQQSDGRTMYQLFVENTQKQLTAGGN